MRMLLALLLSATTCFAQEIPLAPQQQESTAQQPAPAPQPDHTITVPAGTHLQLALANPLRVRGAHIGDAVRVVTNFPVTVGQVLAIPQGTYLEGAVMRIGKRGSTRFDGLEIQFKHMVFANGYAVALEGAVADAREIAPESGPVRVGTQTPFATIFQQQPPTPPPLPQVGPSKGAVIGASLGGMLAFGITMALLGRHRAQGEPAEFEMGYQFEMVLQEPLTLDTARVAVAHLNMDKTKATPDAMSERETVLLPE